MADTNPVIRYALLIPKLPRKIIAAVMKTKAKTTTLSRPIVCVACAMACEEEVSPR
jgi:hypothetical protein